MTSAAAAAATTTTTITIQQLIWKERLDVFSSKYIKHGCTTDQELHIRWQMLSVYSQVEAISRSDWKRRSIKLF